MLPDSCCTWEERFRLFLNFFVRFAVGEVGDLDTEDSSSSDDSSPPSAPLFEAGLRLKCFFHIANECVLYLDWANKDLW